MRPPPGRGRTSSSEACAVADQRYCFGVFDRLCISHKSLPVEAGPGLLSDEPIVRTALSSAEVQSRGGSERWAAASSGAYLPSRVHVVGARAGPGLWGPSLRAELLELRRRVPRVGLSKSNRAQRQPPCRETARCRPGSPRPGPEAGGADPAHLPTLPSSGSPSAQPLVRRNTRISVAYRCLQALVAQETRRSFADWVEQVCGRAAWALSLSPGSRERCARQPAPDRVGFSLERLAALLKAARRIPHALGGASFRPASRETVLVVRCGPPETRSDQCSALKGPGNLKAGGAFLYFHYLLTE
jgi:hypothetical protein